MPQFCRVLHHEHLKKRCHVTTVLMQGPCIEVVHPLGQFFVFLKVSTFVFLNITVVVNNPTNIAMVRWRQLIGCLPLQKLCRFRGCILVLTSSTVLVSCFVGQFFIGVVIFFLPQAKPWKIPDSQLEYCDGEWKQCSLIN